MMTPLFYITMTKRTENVRQLLKRRDTIEFVRLARQLQYLCPYIFERPLLDGQIVDNIENLLTRELMRNKRFHTMDQVSTHTLRRYEMAIYQACSIANDCRVFKRTHTVRRIGVLAYPHLPIVGRTQS